ncbi:MAG: hypothetical protein ONB46_06385 [candidate division KSB1 bacterium]|nr:hypothetical protein [candidate division KSB1 bacterium]MDZ7365330.1 hypothetical protein [candidate division KSB1 bacterium]MDZ7403197.1 hypothetical protein [candidate division KSB1 bacterium]
MKQLFVLLYLIWAIVFASLSHAQSGSAHPAGEIKQALQQAQFQLAADLADSAIASFREYTPNQLAEVHALRALVFFEQGNLTRAEEHLALALQLQSDLQLDPVFFSPQIRQRFEALRLKILIPNQSPSPAVRYVIVPDPRLEAAWRSLLLPGWGQRFKGQTSKGRLFSLATATLAAATITTHVLRERAEQKYLTAGEKEQIAARYDTFNRYHLLRNNLALALGTVWAAAVLDALIVRVEPKSEKVGVVPLFNVETSTAGLALKISR